MTKTKKRILKQTQDNKLAEYLPHITKKFEEVNEFTQKFGEVIDKITTWKEYTSTSHWTHTTSSTNRK